MHQFELKEKLRKGANCREFKIASRQLLLKLIFYNCRLI